MGREGGCWVRVRLPLADHPLFFGCAPAARIMQPLLCAHAKKNSAPPVPHTPHSIMRAHAGRVTCAPPGHGPPAGMRALAAARLRLGPGQLQPRGRCLCRPPSPPDAARAAARNPPTAARHKGRACIIRRRPARSPASTGAWPAHGPGFGAEAYACCVERRRMRRRSAPPSVAAASAVVTALMVSRRALSRGSSLGGAHVSAVGHHSTAV